MPSGIFFTQIPSAILSTSYDLTAASKGKYSNLKHIP